jgi:hemerythrin-like domain-containing protein
VPPGLVYLIVTGLPADGSDAVDPEDGDHVGLLQTSSQHLANPPTDAPTEKPLVAAWMRQRVAADLRLRQAGEQRDLQPPEIAGAGETDDLVSVLGWEHGHLRRWQHELETLPDASAGASASQLRRRSLALEQLGTLLRAHEQLEEQFLWPTVREAVFEGTKLAEHAGSQEREAAELLDALDHVSVDGPEADELVAKLLTGMRKHLAFEDTVFRRFEASTSAETREELGRQVRAARGMATAAEVRAEEEREQREADEAGVERREGRPEREQHGQPERRGERADGREAEAEAGG